MSDAKKLILNSPGGALTSSEPESSPEPWGAGAKPIQRRASAEMGIEAKLREIFQLCDTFNKGTITMRQLAEVCRNSALTSDFFHKLPPVGGVSAMEAILKDANRRGKAELSWEAFRDAYMNRYVRPLAEGPLLFKKTGQVRFVRVFEDRLEHYSDLESASTGSTPGFHITASHVRRVEVHRPSDFVLQLDTESIELRVSPSSEDSFEAWYRALTAFVGQPEEEPSPLKKTSRYSSRASRASSRPRRPQGGGGNSQFEPPPEFLQEVSSSLLEDWISSLAEPPVCHGVLGMSDKGVLVARYGALFQDRFLAYDRPLDAVHGRRPQFNMPTQDMRSFDRVGQGFVVHFMTKNIPFHVVSETDLELWSRKILSILDPQRANGFFRPIEDVTGIATPRSTSTSGTRRVQQRQHLLPPNVEGMPGGDMARSSSLASAMRRPQHQQQEQQQEQLSPPSAELVFGETMARSSSLASGMRRSSSELRRSANEPRQQAYPIAERAKSSGGHSQAVGTASPSPARSRGNRAFFINTHNDARQAGELIHGPHMQVFPFSGRPGGDRVHAGLSGKINEPRSGECSPFAVSGGRDLDDHKPWYGAREQYMTHSPRDPVGHCTWDKINQTAVRSFSPGPRTPRERNMQVAGKVGTESVLYRRTCHG